MEQNDQNETQKPLDEGTDAAHEEIHERPNQEEPQAAQNVENSEVGERAEIADEQ